jgi:hypothetical protein
MYTILVDDKNDEDLLRYFMIIEDFSLAKNKKALTLH